MPLHPQVRAMLDAEAALNAPPAETLPAHIARQNSISTPRPDGPPVHRVFTPRAGDVPLRVYTPPGAGPFTCVIYIHGGGWVLCSLDTHDNICRHLCADAGCVVVSVDYRLAPEHPFPAPLDDCMTALSWVRANATALNVSPQHIVVAGDSAGGNLAALTALRNRDTGGDALAGQLLIYPVADHYASAHGSYAEFATGYGLTAARMRWFWDCYVGPSEDLRGRASPLRAASLAHLPRTWLITAEYDVLHDEGVAFAQRLKEAAVNVEYTNYDGMHHGFFGWPGVLDVSAEAIASAVRWLKLRTIKA